MKVIARPENERLLWPRDKVKLMAKHSPHALLSNMSAGRFTATQLTYAAEYLGDVTTELAAPYLVELLVHEEGFVREGALYGARAHLTDLRVRAQVKKMAMEDTDPDLQEIAVDILREASEKV